MDEQTMDEIISAFNTLRSGGDVAEIRILNTSQGTISGYFDDAERLAAAVQPHLGKQNIYMSVNPVSPELLARSANRLKPYSKRVTTDGEIDRLEFLMIDLDPVRPAGISATDGEHEAAERTARQILGFLREQGFFEPLHCDSGNGQHLLYFLNLPNNQENVALLKDVLAALDFLFSDAAVEVDRTTFNPSRITRLYGTVTCKGDDLPERPHRRSRIVSVPAELVPVPTANLKAVAAHLPHVSKAETQKASTKFLVEDWLADKGLEIVRQAPFQKHGVKYILKQCPWNAEHTNQSAYVLQFENGAVAAGCLHNSCRDQTWNTLRDLLEPDWKGKGGDATEDSDQGKGSDPSSLIISLGEADEYFVNDMEEPYAAVTIGNHKEVLPVKSAKYKMHLTRLFYSETGKAPKSEALIQALRVIEMKAIFSNNERKLQRRMAYHEGSFYYDLADKNWQAIKISPDGCSLLTHPPILFTRSKNMAQQKTPDFSAKPQDLLLLVRHHFRFKEESDLALFTVYLVSCFVASISRVILVLFGEKGAAKSTTMRMIKALVDPAIQDLLSMPTSKQDLAIILANTYMPAFDNLDTLSPEKSDLLCVAATGGAFSKRTLYSDCDETILRFLRCIMVNGISVVVTRADLLDRSILLERGRIPKSERKTEEELWREYDQDVPTMLGAIFNTLSLAMSRRPKVQLEETGRMADFTYWGYAIAEVLGLGGETFLTAYLSNQNQANEETLAAHPVAAAVMAFIKGRKSWAGSVSTFLGELERVAVKDRINTRVKTWPVDASVLSKRLKEVKSNLEEIGIYYDIRHAGNYKKLTIENRTANVNDVLINGHQEEESELDDL